MIRPIWLWLDLYGFVLYLTLCTIHIYYTILHDHYYCCYYFSAYFTHGACWSVGGGTPCGGLNPLLNFLTPLHFTCWVSRVTIKRSRSRFVATIIVFRDKKCIKACIQIRFLDLVVHVINDFIALYCIWKFLKKFYPQIPPPVGAQPSGHWTHCSSVSTLAGFTVGYHYTCCLLTKMLVNKFNNCLIITFIH